MERPITFEEGSSTYLLSFRLLIAWSQVHEQFGELFVMKIVIYGQELLSVLLTPLVLWFTLPQCAPAIIDFFREFTVHVDGLGYVCSFAVFDFQRHGNVKVSGAYTCPVPQHTNIVSRSSVHPRLSAMSG